MATSSLLSGTIRDETLQLFASGPWTAAHAGELERVLADWLEKASGVNGVLVELSGLSEFDTFGAWLVERLRREVRAKGLSVRIIGLPPKEQALLDRMGDVNRQEQQPAPHVPKPLLAFHNTLRSVGHGVAGLWEDMRTFAHMLGGLVLAFGRMVVHPRRFRFTSFVHQLDRVAWKAVPIILLITFLIGAIIAQQGFFHFRKFGADVYVVDMVGILVLRELGVLLVAIMVAGRSGSAYTAELGSMKMREEIDALKTMGFDPVEILVLPRVLVLVVALPMLTFLGSLAALYGGELVAWLYGGMDPEIYVARLKEAINMTHFKVGLVKAPFMGLVIGVLACMEGMKVKGSAASLGQQTTRSVVKSIFMVIVLDGIFAIFFASIGM